MMQFFCSRPEFSEDNVVVECRGHKHSPVAQTSHLLRHTSNNHVRLVYLHMPRTQSQKQGVFELDFSLSVCKAFLGYHSVLVAAQQPPLVHYNHPVAASSCSRQLFIFVSYRTIPKSSTFINHQHLPYPSVITTPSPQTPPPHPSPTTKLSHPHPPPTAHQHPHTPQHPAQTSSHRWSLSASHQTP